MMYTSGYSACRQHVALFPSPAPQIGRGLEMRLDCGKYVIYFTCKSQICEKEPWSCGWKVTNTCITHTHTSTDEYSGKGLEKLATHKPKTQRWCIPLQWSVVGWYPFVRAPRKLSMWPCICHSIHLQSAEGDESYDSQVVLLYHTLVLTSLTKGEATELKCHLRG